MIKDQLKLETLAEKATQLVYNGRMLLAEYAEIPIQTIKDENGEYEIKLVAERKVFTKFGHDLPNSIKAISS